MKIRNIVFSLMFLGAASNFMVAAQPPVGPPYDPTQDAQDRLTDARVAIGAPSDMARKTRHAAFVARGMVGAAALHAAAAYYFEEPMSFSAFVTLILTGGSIGDQIAAYYPLQPSNVDYYNEALNRALIDLNTRTQELDDARQEIVRLQLQGPSRNLSDCRIV